MWLVTSLAQLPGVDPAVAGRRFAALLPAPGARRAGAAAREPACVQLLKLFILDRPAAASALVARDAGALGRFFAGPRRRTELWFGHFGHGNVGSFRFGAGALARFALQHRSEARPARPPRRAGAAVVAGRACQPVRLGRPPGPLVLCHALDRAPPPPLPLKLAPGIAFLCRPQRRAPRSGAGVGALRTLAHPLGARLAQRRAARGARGAGARGRAGVGPARVARQARAGARRGRRQAALLRRAGRGRQRGRARSRGRRRLLALGRGPRGSRRWRPSGAGPGLLRTGGAASLHTCTYLAAYLYFVNTFVHACHCLSGAHGLVAFVPRRACARKPRSVSAPLLEPALCQTVAACRHLKR
jgi:hypothetical protein